MYGGGRKLFKLSTRNLIWGGGVKDLLLHIPVGFLVQLEMVKPDFVTDMQ